jgi:thiol-disulfide isomerase/thioredoxin
MPQWLNDSIMKNAILSVFCLALFGCFAKSPDAPPPAATSPSANVANDSIPFPVYMTYAEFEHLLRRTGDTTYVVNFWATWCKPCVEELPLFEKLIAEASAPGWAGRPVRVLMVSMDFPKDIQRKLVPFVAERNLQRHVVALADMDYNAWIDKVSTEWDGAIPFTLVYRRGHRTVKSGELAGYDELLTLLGQG